MVETARSKMSKDLEQEGRELEKALTISTAKLKEITDHFVKELIKGLSVEGGNIADRQPMNPTWIMDTPTGHEQGTYLTLDMGGTNVRVCEVTLKQKGKIETVQKKFPLPRGIKTGEAEELWEFLAECVDKFIKQEGLLDGDKKNKLGTGDTIPLAFTFSYPVTQESINHGVLQRWTKGFDVKGIEGEDVGSQMDEALRRKGVQVKVAEILNDTATTLLASAYTEPDTQIGSILGTGCNSAYVELCKNIPKLQSRKLPPDSPMIINCEYGAFDNELVVLPRTKYDHIIDKESPRPGQQSYEKMTSGLYLGEIFRHILRDLHERGQIFVGKSVPVLSKPYSIDCLHLSELHEDSETVSSLEAAFETKLDLDELDLCRRIVDLLNMRTARLCACGLAALCKKKGMSSCVIGVDGSVMLKNEKLKKRTMQALGEILDWDEETMKKANSANGDTPVRMNFVQDGSSAGAAIAAAIVAGGRS